MNRYLHARLFVVIFLLLSSLCDSVTAQLSLMDDRKINHSGKDFWLTLRESYGVTPHIFTITGAHDANITFEYTTPGLTRTHFFRGGTILRFQLTPAETEAIAGGGGGYAQPLEVVNNRSLHISSDTDINVRLCVSKGAVDDGVMILPSDNQNWGNEYYLNSTKVVTTLGGALHGHYSIVCRCDSVVLEITPSAHTLSHAAGVPYLITMKKGNSYVFGHRGMANDLSGTVVRVKYSSCCNPINIFINHELTYLAWPVPPPGVPLPVCCADQLIDQVLPVNVWDTIYPVVPTANNQYNLIKIVSASDSNRISFDGRYVVTLNDREGLDTFITRGMVITSTSPVSVTQHMISQTETHRAALSGGMAPTNPDSLSDPSSLWIIPLRDGLREAYFKALGTQLEAPFNPLYKLNYVTIICHAASVNTIQLNNVNIASSFVPFPYHAAYMYARIRLDTSVSYHLVSRDRVSAYYYGSYKDGSTLDNIGDIQVSPFVTAPVRSFEPDSFAMCRNADITLSAGAADGYEWFNGANTESIQVTDTGLYYVHMRYNDSCGRGGTKLFHVTYKDYTHGHDRDTLYKCLRDELTLTGAEADQYQWSTGDTTRSIQVTAMGDAYHVVETYYSECHQVHHEFAVLPKSDGAVSPVQLGDDTLICRGQALVLKGSGPATQWSDGSVGAELKVDRAGTYWARIEESCLETRYEDTIVVSDVLCVDTLNSEHYCGLFFPDAFTPNADGRNDVFKGIRYGEYTTVTEYHLSIFNRWGAQVYETTDITRGWDGIYKGMPSEVGVYYYLCRYSCPLLPDRMIKGEVTLVR